MGWGKLNDKREAIRLKFLYAESNRKINLYLISFARIQLNCNGLSKNIYHRNLIKFTYCDCEEIETSIVFFL